MAGLNTISGKYLSVQIGNQILRGSQSWECTETADQLDGTTGADEGFENDDVGVKRAEIELELVMNLATGQYAMIAAGTLLQELALYRASTDSEPAFLFPNARVYRSVQGGRVKERFTVRVSARSNGPYTSAEPTSE